MRPESRIKLKRSVQQIVTFASSVIVRTSIFASAYMIAHDRVLPICFTQNFFTLPCSWSWAEKSLQPTIICRMTWNTPGRLSSRRILSSSNHLRYSCQGHRMCLRKHVFFWRRITANILWRASRAGFANTSNENFSLYVQYV